MRGPCLLITEVKVSPARQTEERSRFAGQLWSQTWGLLLAQHQRGGKLAWEVRNSQFNQNGSIQNDYVPRSPEGKQWECPPGASSKGCIVCGKLKNHSKAQEKSGWFYYRYLWAK